MVGNGFPHVTPTEATAARWREVRDAVLARDQRACVSCGSVPAAGEADIHHLVPRAAGGLDDPSNLITLCDGCHAARHPNLQASLARRTLERWGLRLARWLDRERELGSVDEALGAALRLLGASRFRHPQLEVVLAALRGESVLSAGPRSGGPASRASGAEVTPRPVRRCSRGRRSGGILDRPRLKFLSRRRLRSGS